MTTRFALTRFNPSPPARVDIKNTWGKKSESVEIQERFHTPFLHLENYLFAWTRVEVINKRLAQVGWSRTIKSGKAIAFTNKEFFKYVQHPGNYSSTSGAEIIQTIACTCRKMLILATTL